MVVNLRWKISICSQGAESGAEFLHLGKRDPAWKPITSVPLIGFYSRAMQSCAFQEVSAKHRRGHGQAQLKESKRPYQRPACYPRQQKRVPGLAVSQAMLLRSPRGTFGTSLANQLFNCSPAFQLLLGGGGGHGAFLLTKVVLGRPWSTRPIFMFYWITVQKGILHQKP